MIVCTKGAFCGNDGEGTFQAGNSRRGVYYQTLLVALAGYAAPRDVITSLFRECRHSPMNHQPCLVFLLDKSFEFPGELFYWREKNLEVDFIYRYQGCLYAVEVKSGRRKSSRGLEAFLKQFPDAYPVIITVDNFPGFSENPLDFLRALR